MIEYPYDGKIIGSQKTPDDWFSKPKDLINLYLWALRKIEHDADAIGNLVPACKSCNSQKRDSDPVKWFSRQPTYSQEKLERILEVLGVSEAVQLDLFA